MQCASSHTRVNALDRNESNTRRRKPGLARRSGAISNRSTSSEVKRASRSSQASTLDELMVTAVSPRRSAAATWSRISASNGEITTVGPQPRARSIAVAEKYTADLPKPVRATRRVRCRSATTAVTASICSGRGSAFGPASALTWAVSSSATSARLGRGGSTTDGARVSPGEGGGVDAVGTAMYRPYRPPVTAPSVPLRPGRNQTRPSGAMPAG